MTEEKIKNRGWVKNAAIIFLSVMLLLTFFSNTIMNRSLPEVSAQYVQSGTINTKIRGTGTITAAETFEVKATDSRKVKSVAVTVGQTVKAGDLLFVLAAGESEELKAAQDALEQLQYDYQVALINTGNTNSNGDNTAVSRAREKLQAAIAARDASTVSDEDLSIAKTVLVTATAAYNKANDDFIAAGGDSTGSSGDYSAVTAAQNAMNSAKTALDAAKIKYKAAYDALKEDATAQAAGTGYTIDAYMEYLAGEYATKDGEYTLVSDPTKKFAYKQMSAAYTAIETAQGTYDNAVTAYNKALETYYDSFSPDNSALKKKVDDAKRVMDAAQKTYDDLVAKRAAYTAANDNVIACQDALESAIKTQRLDTLSLSRMRSQIADAKAKVAELSTGTAGGKIVSDVDGVVKAINVTAGNMTDPSTAMATIEVPDRGYAVSLTVTTEQARKVSVGDAAEVTTGYWGGNDLTGTLVNIKTDPQAPTQNKILVIEVKGETVESGTQVSISLGQKSQNYEVIVPNSAIREDSNGNFVLIVVAKNSPLGNRYVATRVDVQVLAKDDTSSAISGGVSAWDFVITNSTKPVESGTLVRLAENG